jgi:cyclic dehypoxanthinyl futalosine synthase
VSDALEAKIEQTRRLGGNPILLQGGLHPEFKLEWYEDLLRDIRSRFPGLREERPFATQESFSPA